MWDREKHQAQQLRLAQVLVGREVRVDVIVQSEDEDMVPVFGVLDGIADFTTAPRLVLRVGDGQWVDVPLHAVFEVEAVEA